MSALLDLVRPDLRDFAGYASARRDAVAGSVWLNANESPWSDAAALNRYPEPQPAALRARLAALYGVADDAVLVGRGSDEPIDLLVRTLCVPGTDAVVVTPPVFGMYAVAARLQGAARIDVPLRDGDDGFVADVDGIGDAAIAGGAKLVFLCSPSNPTGGVVAPDAVLALARRLDGRAVVVVDEAYGEYSGVPSLAPAIATQPNLAVLRTLSKAHGLAAARIGCLLAAPALVAVLRNAQAPYPLPGPSVAAALAALEPAALARMRERVAGIVAERERVAAALARAPGVRRVYPSTANFVLARFVDAGAALRGWQAAGIVVRDMRAFPGLDDALRITIGTPGENDALLAALHGARAVA